MATTSIAEAREAYSELTTKLDQLEALLLMTVIHAGCSSFGMLAQSARDDYMSVCTDIVQSCQSLSAKIAPAVIEERA